MWINEKNNFLVFQLHYTANENATKGGHIDRIKKSMPMRQFMQEYELQWESFEGQPVYVDWNPSVHKSREPLMPERGLPLFRGWDFGLTPACVIGQFQDDRLLVLREFTEQNMGIVRFKEKVMRECAILYPFWKDQIEDYRDYVDPSGFFKKDTDETTCAKILASPPNKIRPFPGPVAWEQRRQAVEHFLTKMTKNGPCFLIDPVNCPVLVRGFNGGYRYDPKDFEIQPGKIRPLKDEHSHPQDALQYMCSGIIKSTKPRGKPIPSPVYSFSSERVKK